MNYTCFYETMLRHYTVLFHEVIELFKIGFSLTLWYTDCKLNFWEFSQITDKDSQRYYCANEFDRKPIDCSEVDCGVSKP